MRAQSARASSRAAAFGGTTTFIDFGVQDDGGLQQAIEHKQAELRADRPHVDYALHAIVSGQISSEVLDEIKDAIADGVNRQGRQQGTNIYLARLHLAEEAAIRKVLLLSQRSGSPVYVVHVSTHAGVAAIGEARAAGQPAYGEILHNYLTSCSDDYARPNGLTYHNCPPLKSAADREPLWQAMGTCRGVDTVVSDDFTIPLAGAA